jgi:transcriptional regulator with XRE-family HTH domain
MQLKEICKQLGISGKEIAQKAGCTEGWVSLVLSNQRTSNRVVASVWSLIHDRREALESLRDHQHD